jgi:uncharacterized protein YkwD
MTVPIYTPLFRQLYILLNAIPLLKYTILICLLLGLAACASDEPSPDINVAMLNRLNSIRAAGCTCGTTSYTPAQKLTLEGKLSDAAFAHAQDMYQQNYFSHVSPQGISPEERVTAAGYPGSFLAENIASGCTTVNEAVNAWLQSPSHCEAIMTHEADEMGVAQVNSYWVLELGKKN